MNRTVSMLLVAGAMAVASPAWAQGDMPESYRAVQQRMLQMQRRLLLAMTDSMPERLYGDKVTPAQRGFSAQIIHATVAVGRVGPMVMGIQGAPGNADTAAALTSRTALRAYINATYDWAANTLRDETAADRLRIVDVFGTRMPRWQVWDEMHMHTAWTAGQVVANFRKHNMAPPGFSLF